MADTYCCTHFAVAHEPPKTRSEQFDNIALIICSLTTLLVAIEEREDDTTASDLAGMGREMCHELRRRIQRLEDWKSKAATPRAMTLKP